MAVDALEPNSKPFTVDDLAVEVPPTDKIAKAPESDSRTITRTYTDGTVVQTNVNDGVEPPAILSVVIQRPDGSVEAYQRRSVLTGNPDDKGFVIMQHHLRPTGQVILSVPGATIDLTTREALLSNKEVADPGNARETVPHVNDTTDDLDVIEVNPLPTSPNDTHVPFEVLLEDGTSLMVRVQKAVVPAGKTAADVAKETGERIGTLPPKIRNAMSEKVIRVEDLSGYNEPGKRPNGGVAFSTDGVALVIDPNSPIVQDLSKFAGIMVHEMGHEVDYVDSAPVVSSSPEWAAAMDADNADASTYAGTSREEDFAETFALWYEVRSGAVTGPKAAAIEARYENRFAVLDDTPSALDALPDAA